MTDGQYFSASKKAWLPIKEMPSPHALNAWRKLVGWVEANPDADAREMFEANKQIADLEVELESRGFRFDRDSGRWDGPATDVRI